MLGSAPRPRPHALQEEILAEQLISLDSMLKAMDLKSKFENRKQLLLDLDAYKRKASYGSSGPFLSRAVTSTRSSSLSRLRPTCVETAL